MRLALPLVAVALFALDACATTDTATTQQQASAEQTPRRRRRRRRHTDENGDIATMPTMGSTSSTAPDGTSSSPAPSDGSATSSTSPDANGSRSVFGSPLVQQSQDSQVTPRWIVEEGHGRIECEGNDERPVPPPSPQCPQEPSNAAIVRAFVPLEREVLACSPPANPNGRLPMHVTFGAAGYPLEITFPGVRVLRRAATCMGRVLCGARVPNFRSSEATVDYEYVVLVPASE